MKMPSASAQLDGVQVTRLTRDPEDTVRSRPEATIARRKAPLAKIDAHASRMVSVVVSIRMRNMFMEVRKMFVNARHAEQDVRERQASRNF